MSTLDVVNALEAAGCGPRQSGPGFSARCPAHDDRNPSLSVADGDNGGTIITCHRGCVLDDVLVALRLTREAIRPQREVRDEIIDTYPYVDAEGELLFEVVRYAGHKFRQRRPDGKGGWIWSLGDVARPIYRLPRVIQAVADGELVFIVEGEKDVHAIERAGFAATCNSGGAGKWRAEYAQWFQDADVLVVADRDDVGQAHARSVAQSLEGVAVSVVRVEAAHGKDAFDHLASGLTVDDFLTVSEGDPVVDLAPDLDQFLDHTDEYHWVVPGLLEEMDRLMVTGFEGHGKSHLLRQISVCVAAGMDPFRFARIQPRRVLFIDLENSERHTRRQMRPLRDLMEHQGCAVAPGMLRIIMRPNGLNLNGLDDAEWLMERVRSLQPELLVIGPLYRMHAANPNDELAARMTAAAIDAARTEARCAVIVEAHAGHGEAGRRDARPVGSSLWLRWPEFGFGMIPDKERSAMPYQEEWLRVWRGQRDERSWPDKIARGLVFPWQGVWTDGMPDIEEGEDEPF